MLEKMACVGKGKQYRTTCRLFPEPSIAFAVFVCGVWCAYAEDTTSLTWHAIESSVLQCRKVCAQLAVIHKAGLIEDVKMDNVAISNQVFMLT